jgi:hypothetical protein
MASLNYEKRKNQELFGNFKDAKYLDVKEIQNYIPIYNKQFLLNETNYNSVNLNHQWYIHSIKKEVVNKETKSKLYKCELKNNHTPTKTRKQSVFFKLAPLLDPLKFLIGKYDIKDEKWFQLPKWNSQLNDGIHPRILDENHCAYVDSFFSFLSNSLIERYNFQHGMEFYGSFLAIKNNYKVNVIDDLDYLCKSTYFNQHKNKLFHIEDYYHLVDYEEDAKMKPIKIDYSTSKKSISIKSIKDDLFEDIFEEGEQMEELIDTVVNREHYTLDDLKEYDLPFPDSGEKKIDKDDEKVTIHSGSSCSSRTSHTSENDEEESSQNTDNKNTSASSSVWEECSDTDEEEDEDEDEDEKIESTFEKFPVQIICMEHCENTFDSLIINEELSQDEWLSALLQIIMILIVYQEAFCFTHNDLHTNNVMFNETDEPYLYYHFQNKYYKVPTFGRIYKIIDFGRAIYQFNGKKYCSDSFQIGGDAVTQYNTEPYFNEKKPRLEPNYSFDLCRLACSIFDYLIDDFDELSNIIKENPIADLIVDWCIDDNGLNVLYKNNGLERYPDFKLYKMIARCVHNHTPHAQLERNLFKSFVTTKDRIESDKVLNIDDIVNL